EAAGVGCAGVLAVAGVLGKLSREALAKALEGTALVAAMIFAIIVGGYLMARLVAVTGLTELLVERMVALDLGRVSFLLLLVALYIVLGAFLDVFGMLVLTIPFIIPVLAEIGIDLIWFGVFAVMMTELALVTPPIGANVFVMRRVAPDVPMGDIFRGVLPFVLGVLAVLALLTAFPGLVMWLPDRM
ncbi:MAG: TRAP transporter large permease subunit, partial [Gemmatimonadota bacterium]|nr:TRAP transporter large permease subunit [Gemmatimonadota bacterium]